MRQYHGYHECGDLRQDKQWESPGMIGIKGAAWIGEGGAPQGGGRDDQADARFDCRPGQRSAVCKGGLARRPGCRAGRDVGDEGGQVGVGPRGERLARSRVKFVPGQPAVHERSLQRVDHVFAVG